LQDDIEQELKYRAARFDDYLEELMAQWEMHARLKESISHTLLAGGKRIRPILTMLICDMLEGNLGAARTYGAALEFIHTYSLIHDDLPAMDDDEMRRGKKCNHLIFGEGMAVLAGDALQSMAFEMIGEIDLPAETRMELVDLLAGAAGPGGMVGGQVMDLEAEDRKVDLEELKRIHAAKTGQLFRAAILGGVLCSEHSREEWKILDDFSRNLGLTFQIVDDILDVVGDEEKLGKEVGQDEAREKSTYPSLLGLEESRRRAEEAASRAREALGHFGDRARTLIELVDFIERRQH